MKKTKTTSGSTSKPLTKSALPAAATPSEAQRLAAMILEVLAGIGTPLEAAQMLSVSLPRYYQLEARALEGLVTARGPRPKGKQQSLEKRIQLLEKQLEAAHRQCARQQALVRVTQRTLGVTLATKPKSTTPDRDPAGRKKRRPTVRALKAARTLQAQAAAHDVSSNTCTTSTANTGILEPASLQPAVPQHGAEEVQPCSA